MIIFNLKRFANWLCVVGAIMLLLSLILAPAVSHAQVIKGKQTFRDSLTFQTYKNNAAKDSILSTDTAGRIILVAKGASATTAIYRDTVTVSNPVTPLAVAHTLGVQPDIIECWEQSDSNWIRVNVNVYYVDGDVTQVYIDPGGATYASLKVTLTKF